MRALLGLISFIIAWFMMSALFYDHVALLAGDRTPLSVQLEAVLARWAREGAGGDARILSIALSDDEGWRRDPLGLPVPPPEKPGFIRGLGDRLFGPPGGSRHSGEYAFTLVIGGAPDLIDWSYRGRTRAGEAAAAADFARILVKASGSNAEVRVVTYGYAAAVVLKALQAEPAARVASLTAAGMDLESLRDYDPRTFSGFHCPSNLRRWVNVRGEDGGAVLTETFSAGDSEPKRERSELLDRGFQTAVLAVRRAAAGTIPLPAAPGRPDSLGIGSGRPEGPSGPPGASGAPRLPASPKGFPVKGRSMFIIKEAGEPTGSEPKTDRLSVSPPADGSMALGDSEWRVIPPRGFGQMWVNRPAPDRLGVLTWTKPRVRDFDVKIWLTFGRKGLNPELDDGCSTARMRPSRTTVRGYPVDVCSGDDITEDQGTHFGSAYFTLHDGDFLLQVRYDYPTARKQDAWAEFEKVCDSLYKP